MLAILLLLALLGVLLPMVTLSVLALSLLLDNGCLRGLLFLAGWSLFAPVAGAALAVLLLALAGMEGNLSAEAGYGAQAFLIVYPIVAVFLYLYFDRLSEEKRAAWKSSLTNGALFGFGAGAVGKAATAATGGFGGFGGGSFGGGGAGGSFKGSAAAAGGAAKAAGGPGTAETVSAVGAGAATSPTTTAAGETEVRAHETEPDETELDETELDETSASAQDASSKPQSASQRTGRRGSFSQYIEDIRFRHVLGFLLVAIAFLPFGIGLARASLNPVVQIVGLGLLGAYALNRVLKYIDSETVASFSERLADLKPSWNPAVGAVLALVATVIGGPIVLAGLLLLFLLWPSNEESTDASFDGGTAASSWQ